MRAFFLASALMLFAIPASAQAPADCANGGTPCAPPPAPPSSVQPRFSYDGEPKIFRRRHRRDCPAHFVWDAALGRCVSSKR